ncbi:uncharacterized protein [Rutidosis leptorrhynchoides]|uniref:uncharacterized protein n=1 Tax=Rutidosis leptorrhynchoides TaxID=125765 RepID=UPI003A9A4057
MEDTAGIDIEFITSNAVNNVNISQSNDLTATVSSPSTLTDNRSSGLVNETSYEPIGTVEIVADKLAIDETDEKPNLIKTPEPDFENTAAKDLEIKTSDVANDKVLPQNDNLIISVSSPSTLTDNQSAGLVTDEKLKAVDEETDEKPKPADEETDPKPAVEIDADKSAIKDTDEMPKPTVEIDAKKSAIEETDEKPKPADEEIDEKLKPADEETDPKPAVEIDADKSAIDEADEKPKPTDEEINEKPKPADEETDSKPAVEIDVVQSAIEETDEKPKPAVEIDADKSAIEETDEKPKPTVEIDAVKLATKETVENPKPAVEIDVVKSAIKETDEKPKLIETPEPDMEDTAAKDIKIKTSNAANEEVLTQNVDTVVVSSPSKLAENRSSEF